jgi:hypothetical protein
MFQNLDLWFILYYCLFVKKKFCPLFLLSVLLSFSPFLIYILSPFIFPLFRPCFVPVFLAHVVSSLAYPNLLGLKNLVVVVVWISWRKTEPSTPSRETSETF